MKACTVVTYPFVSGTLTETTGNLISSFILIRGLYSPPGIPPGIRLESRNSAGLTTEFDIPAEFTRNLMGILVS
jgi:hypothetical protein